MNSEQTKSNNSALYTLITVFFFWGFIGASNGIFIPFCKAKFGLDQFQSQLIDFAFYGAYADTPTGPAGVDPVGPAVVKLREQSRSLEEFLNRISWMTSFQALEKQVAK